MTTETLTETLGERPYTAKITQRNPDLPFESTPKYWHSGDPFKTIFFNTFSMMFPEGELFFVESVRLFQDQITDPELKRDVKAFIQQEAMHRKEHGRYNALLDQFGFDNALVQRNFKSKVDVIRGHAPAKSKLGITAAFEHYTAILSEVVLEDFDSFMGQADPEMQQLWMWHTIEETEHKSVALDVYRHVGGGYPRRCSIFFWVTINFILDYVIIYRRLLKQDRRNTPVMWWKLFRYCFIRPAILGRMMPKMLRYFKPGFQPWRESDKTMLTYWYQRLNS